MNSSPDRDQSTERLLRQSLKAPNGAAATDACLDAEAVAAWVDGGLTNVVLDQARLHVADCARCQALVGALARTDGVVSLVEPVRTTPRWRLAWLMPVAAAAAALAVWVALPSQPETRPTSIPAVTQEADSRSVTADPGAGGPLTLPPSSTTLAEGRRQEAPPQVNPTPPDVAKRVASTFRDRAAPSAAAPPPRVDAALEAKSADRLVPSAPSGAIASAASAAPAASANRVAETSAPSATGQALLRAATLGAEIVSPDPLVRWRVAGASVEHSVDAGARWETVRTGNTTALLAGSSPSTAVCWVVGRAGVVLLTTDGRTWRRVAFPETTDLSAVRATDGRIASVSTSDGRTFSTTDGGSTWSR